DESNEVQLYIFEMESPLKALGKYGSEKPAEAVLVEVGDEGYTTAGSTLFYADRYYTQIVSTKDSPEFASFAHAIAERVAAKQAPARAQGATAETGEGASSTPATMFKLLPAGPKRSGEKYVAQDVFGYEFLSDVFLADYASEDG